MATGDLTMFEEFSLAVGAKKIDFGNDTFKVGLITNAGAPTAADTTPTWSDYSGNEVSGTGYTAGGATLASVTHTEAGGTATFDAADVTWSQNGAGPTDIRYAVVYSDTSTNDDCICFVQMGTGDVSLQSGDVTITWTGSGIFTVS